MYISWQGNLVKNIAIAFFNGLITLILLLIAPLGLASVIFNTAAVTVSSFVVATICDGIARWLINSSRLKILDEELSDSQTRNLLRQPKKRGLGKRERR